MPTPKASDTLLSYLRVQENFDRQLYAVLQRAASDAEKQITALAGKQGIGAVIRREQVAAVKKALHTQMADTLEREGFIIGAGYERAAAAAITTFEAYDKMLMGSIFDDEQVQAYLRSARQTSRIGIDAARQRLLGTSYIPLSEQVYKTTQLANGMVDRLVESALTRGLSARELAREVRDFIQPNVQGGVSYAALRLARTEINNAFHAVQAEKARTTPWITGLQWNISGSHPDLDECDEYANEQHFHGGEPGVFLPEEIPMKPHPQCLCFTTPVTVSQDVFLNSFFAGEYDTYIDDVIENGGTGGSGAAPFKIAAPPKKSISDVTPKRWSSPTSAPIPTKFTDDEAYSAKYYTTGGSEAFNGTLRGLRQAPANFPDGIEKFTTLLNRQKTNETLLVSRGVDKDAFRLHNATDASSLVGQTFHESGFTSTALANTAQDPTDLYKAIYNKDINIRMTVPPGTPGANVSQFSTFKNEAEFTMPPGVEYIVTKYEVDPAGRVWLDAIVTGVKP